MDLLQVHIRRDLFAIKLLLVLILFMTTITWVLMIKQIVIMQKFERVYDAVTSEQEKAKPVEKQEPIYL